MTDEIINELAAIAEVESIEKHYDENGNYTGATVTYTNPIMPELKTVYHPYIPLQICKSDNVVPVITTFNTRYGGINIDQET